MANIHIAESTLSSIAEAIREKWWLAGSMPVSSMAGWVSSIMTTSEYLSVRNSSYLTFPILREIHGADSWNPYGVSLPNIRKIGDYAFYSCGHLGRDCVQSIITQMVSNGGSEIGDYAFYNNYYGTQYDVAELDLTGITKIGNNAFFGISANSKATFDLFSLTYLGTGLKINNFSSYRTISTMELSLLEYIGDDTFHNCFSLCSINMPNCSYIGNATFSSCTSLNYVNIPKCKYIGNNAFFRCSKLSYISPMSNCSYIGRNAFWSCYSLASISIPNCSYIDNGAFSICSSLSYISPMPNCSYIGSYAFAYCYSLTSISISNCSYIGSNAFYYCSNLLSIYIPNCSYIGSSAFYSCSKLSAIYMLSKAVPTLSNANAFYSTPISNSTYLGTFGSIYVLSSLVNTFKTAKNWSLYSSRITAYTGT